MSVHLDVGGPPNPTVVGSKSAPTDRSHCAVKGVWGLDAGKAVVHRCVEQIAYSWLERAHPPTVEHANHQLAHDTEVICGLWGAARLEPLDVVVDANRVSKKRPDDRGQLAGAQPLVVGVKGPDVVGVPLAEPGNLVEAALDSNQNRVGRIFR